MIHAPGILRVLGLIGSPRKGGNTDILVDTILDEAARSGHDTTKHYLHDYDIGPCIDCRRCKQGDLRCVLDDGMREFYSILDSSDVIVFGTPIYWFGPTGTMKQFIDRLRPYYASRRLEGKKAILVSPANDGPKEADLLVGMLSRSFRHLGILFIGSVLGTAYDSGDIRNDVTAMEEAAGLGRSLGMK